MKRHKNELEKYAKDGGQFCNSIAKKILNQKKYKNKNKTKQNTKRAENH